MYVFRQLTLENYCSQLLIMITNCNLSQSQSYFTTSIGLYFVAATRYYCLSCKAWIEIRIPVSIIIYFTGLKVTFPGIRAAAENASLISMPINNKKPDYF